MDMENLGTEVSAKIRSAIKAKLVELNAYVDDELPDYIMVMIANKKTEAQMEEDLTLFLNEKAPTFAQWLHSVLAKLQKVTFGGGQDDVKKSKNAKKSKAVESGKKKNKLKIKSDTDKSNLKQDKSEFAKNNEHSNEQLNNKNSWSDTNIPLKEDKVEKERLAKNVKQQKTNNEEKPKRSSLSPTSSKSFSVSKSPSPSQRRNSDIRLQRNSQNRSRSPNRRSPAEYRDHTQGNSGYQDFRRRPQERGNRERQRSFERYDNTAPRNTNDTRGVFERDRGYERQGPRRMQYDRSRPPPFQRRSPHYERNMRGDGAMRHGRNERSMYSDDYRNYRNHSPYRDKPKSPRQRQENMNRSHSPAIKSVSKVEKGNGDEYSSKRDRKNDGSLDRTSKSTHDRRKNSTRRQSSSASPSPKQGKTLSSSIGAVISHESDGEYNPEKLLKKSIVASKVSVTSRPGRSTKDANPKMVRRAAMDAEMDIRKKKVDARQRDNELDQIRINRQRLTKAMQRGELDEKKIKEINQPDSHIRRRSPSYSKDGRMRIPGDTIRSEPVDHYKNERSVRKLKKEEIIPPRKAAMDRENTTVRSKLHRKPEQSERRHSECVQRDENEREEDSDTNTLEDTLPDLRQRLVDRKRKRRGNDESNNDHVSKKDQTDQKRSIFTSNSHRNQSKTVSNDDEEHQILNELLLDKNGRKILPKNLRIQATIRNDRHMHDSDRTTETLNSKDVNLNEPSTSRKRYDGSIKRNDRMDNIPANKRRRVDETTYNTAEKEDGEDELSEMRRNAIESMQRKRELATSSSDSIALDTKKSSKQKHRSIQQDKKEKSTHGRNRPEKDKKDLRSRRDSQIETLKQVILEIQDGDSDDMSSVSSEEESVSDVSEDNDNKVINEKDKEFPKDSKVGEESEISLSSSEDENEYSSTRIAVHTAKKSHYQQIANEIPGQEGYLGSDNKEPKFVVTLDGINSAYFKKEDKEVSKGGLKLKKQEPTSHIVYIKTNRPNVSSSEASKPVTEKPVITLPTSKIKNEPSKSFNDRNNEGYMVSEKPKAMVAPLRSTISSNTKLSNTDSPSKNLPSNQTSTTSTPSLPSKGNDPSSSNENVQIVAAEIPKRKRILPPDLSPTGSPHSVLAGANRYSRTLSDNVVPSPGIMSVCKFWPNCNKGYQCAYHHPKGSTSGPTSATVKSGSRPDKFKWTSTSALQ